MTAVDIKGRKEVLDAIAEFNRLGRDRFLEKYKACRMLKNSIPRT